MTKKNLERLLEKHKKAMGLSLWDIDLKISKNDSEESGAAATMIQQRRYLWAQLTVYKDAFKKPHNISDILVHELCHLITEPLYEYCYDFLNGRFVSPDTINHEREKMTEHIAKIYRGFNV